MQNIVVGFGISGLSCARFLERQGLEFAIADSRVKPPNADFLQQEFAHVEARLGEWDADWLQQADTLILSPGIPRQLPAIQAAMDAGVQVINDIELFCRYATAPIVGITGTNGKSTVTSLVGEMLQVAGLSAAVGGNLGIGALDLLQDIDHQADVYVLELSSFQLESVQTLPLSVACLLNVTPDHLDRYASFADYVAAKQRIYQDAKCVVFNQDDNHTWPTEQKKSLSFSLGCSETDNYHLNLVDNEVFLAYKGQNLLSTMQLNLQGRHNWANALAALSIGHCLNLPQQAMCQALSTFPGLPHRTQRIRELEQVTWINDSKGTNVGACVAAIKGIGVNMLGKIILIAGGQAKDDDFTDMYEPVKEYVRSVVLIGQDADKIQAVLADVVPTTKAKDMEEAVQVAKANAQRGDVVLMSPACASFDMYDNFMHRGDHFRQCVDSLC